MFVGKRAPYNVSFLGCQRGQWPPRAGAKGGQRPCMCIHTVTVGRVGDTATAVALVATTPECDACIHIGFNQRAFSSFSGVRQSSGLAFRAASTLVSIEIITRKSRNIMSKMEEDLAWQIVLS
jgi:hypothetical protein